MAGLGVDVGKIIGAFFDVAGGTDIDVAVDLVIDPTAPDALVDAVLSAFVDVDSDATVETVVLGAGGAAADAGGGADGGVVREAVESGLPVPCDLAVIVGGESPLLGDAASAGRAMGIPSVIVVSRGEARFAFADDGPAAPGTGGAAATAGGPGGDATVGGGEAGSASAPKAAGATGDGLERCAGVPLDDLVDVDVSGGAERPLEELGEWIVRNAPAKREGLAANFPFVRHPLALEFARENATQNGAIGLVFFVPGADMPVITANQARLVLQIAAIYGHDVGRERIREVACVIASGFGLRGVARALVSLVPAISWAVKPAVAAGGTMAIACAAVAYFEDPANVARVDGAIDRARDAVRAVRS